MAIEKIQRIDGRGLPLPGDNIDTDRIIPARFLRAITFEGLEQHLVAMGVSIAETMLELFRDFPPDHPFFDEFSFIPAN